MEFLIISDTKLKATLSREECLRYKIDTSDSDFSTNEIRLAIREILEIAKEKCGFSVGKEKILVQLYPMPDGSCEIFVTKLTSLTERERGIVRETDGLTTYQEKRGTYRFSDISRLWAAARAIYRPGIQCDLYRSNTGEYYIHICEDFTDGISEFEILIEYGERLGSLPLFVMSEYGKLLAKGDAVDYILKEE